MSHLYGRRPKTTRISPISCFSPTGPYTVSGSLRSRSAKDLSMPGSPSQWSAWKCVMNTLSRSSSPTERSSWRCVPSPQSNSRRSPPRRMSTAGSPRRALGTEPAVPAKNSDRSMVATVAATGRARAARRERAGLRGGAAALSSGVGDAVREASSAPVAQWIERSPPEREVGRSNRPGRAGDFLALHQGSHRLFAAFSVPPDQLNPRVTARRLPQRIARNRVEQAARDAADRARLERPIAAHLTARRLALDALAHAHQALADGSDLDLTGRSRPAAVWQMAGRCIGIARALISLIDQGFSAEVLHLGRALHEASRLLSALGNPDEDELLCKWLDGDYVSPGVVRGAEQRYEERLAAAMIAEGKQELPRTGPVTKHIYAKMSEAAHHQRAAVEGEVAPLLRTMPRGPDPTWERRATAASVMLSVVGEGIDAAGEAIARFHGAAWYDEHVAPYWAAFEALAREQPLR